MAMPNLISVSESGWGAYLKRSPQGDCLADFFIIVSLRLCSEVVVKDAFRRNPEAVKKIYN